MNKELYNWVPQLCPICELPPRKFIGRRGGMAHRENLGVECKIWRCDKCGLIFPNPMPIPIGGPDQHYRMGPDEYFEHHAPGDKARSALALLQKAGELIKGRGRLLDIGAGRGEVLQAAIEAGWTAVGIEPSASFAEHISRESGAEVRRDSLEDCRFESNSFDVVLLSAVLEHLYDPDRTIAEIARILRPGGVLFVDVPNEAGLYFRVGNLYQRLRGRDWVVNLAPTFSPFHVFGFSPRSLRALLAKYRLQPQHWQIYAGEAMVPSRQGMIGFVEKLAARGVTAVSRLGNLGTYIETWAVRE
jgi:SAM-dependent methyltransferase